MIETPRYLCGFDSLELPHRLTDVLVIGSGIAGLRCALEVSRAAKVLVVTKDVPQETVTALALSPSQNRLSHPTLRTR